MNIYHKLINNSIIFLVGNLGSKLLILLLVPLYTFYLTPSEFGLADMITVSASILIPIFTLSMIESILRFIMDKSYDKQSVLMNALFVSFFGLILITMLFPFWEIIFKDKIITIFFIFLIYSQTIYNIITQFVRAIGLIKLFALSGIINATFLLIGNTIYLICLDMSINGYLLSFITSNIITSIFIFYIAKIKNYINLRKVNKELIKEMLIYSLPLIPNTLMWWTMSFSDRFLLTYYWSYAATGIFAIASKFPSILYIVNSVFFQAWQMSAIEEANSKDKTKFYTTVFNVFALTMLSTTSLILTILKPIIEITVSNEYYESWKYVPFLLFAAVFSSFSSFLGTNYVASKKTIGAFKTSIIAGILNLILNIILIPILGIQGAAISTMLSFLVLWLWRINDTRGFVNINYNFKKFSMSFLVLIIQVFNLFYNSSLELVTHLFLFILILLINKKEIEVLIFQIHSRYSYKKNKSS